MGSELATIPTGISLLAELERQGALSPTHLDLSSVDMPFDRTEALARALSYGRDILAFALSDLLCYAEEAFGEDFAQIAEATGRAPGTLQNWLSVGRRVHPDARREDLFFSHHVEVTKFPFEEQCSWLKRAAENGWTVAELRQHLRESGHRPALAQPAWTERERVEREQKFGRLLGEVVEAVADPNPERLTVEMPKIAERARALLAEVPDVGKRRLTCPACSHEFEED